MTFFKFFDKKKILIMSFISSILYFVLGNKNITYSVYDSGCLLCRDFLSYMHLALLSAVPIFLLSIVFFSEKYFTHFKRTIVPFLVIFSLNLAFTPWYIRDILMNSGKQLDALLIVAVYILVMFVYFFVLLFKKILQSKV